MLKTIKKKVHDYYIEASMVRYRKNKQTNKQTKQNQTKQNKTKNKTHTHTNTHPTHTHTPHTHTHPHTHPTHTHTHTHKQRTKSKNRKKKRFFVWCLLTTESSTMNRAITPWPLFSYNMQRCFNTLATETIYGFAMAPWFWLSFIVIEHWQRVI